MFMSTYLFLSFFLLWGLKCIYFHFVTIKFFTYSSSTVGSFLKIDSFYDL